jgi:hypothetical protein
MLFEPKRKPLSHLIGRNGFKRRDVKFGGRNKPALPTPTFYASVHSARVALEFWVSVHFAILTIGHGESVSPQLFMQVFILKELSANDL